MLLTAIIGIGISFSLLALYTNFLDVPIFAPGFAGATEDLTVSLSDQRWGSRSVRDPWTLFRNRSAWRPNPRMDDARASIETALKVNPNSLEARSLQAAITSASRREPPG